MSENIEKKVLIGVNLKAEESLKNLAELKMRIDDLRAAQKKLDKFTEEGRLEFESLGQQIKGLTAIANF